MKRGLRLDAERSLIATNVSWFVWRGPDVRPAPHRDGSQLYGIIPARLFDQVREQVLALTKRGALRMTRRGE